MAYRSRFAQPVLPRQFPHPFLFQPMDIVDAIHDSVVANAAGTGMWAGALGVLLSFVSEFRQKRTGFLVKDPQAIRVQMRRPVPDGALAEMRTTLFLSRFAAP